MIFVADGAVQGNSKVYWPWVVSNSSHISVDIQLEEPRVLKGKRGKTKLMENLQIHSPVSERI